MHSPIHEEVFNGHTIKIYIDDDPECPREWDNLGTLICAHQRYNLGDKHSFPDARSFLLDLCGRDDVSEWPIDRIMYQVNRIAVILPVFLYDHSGLILNTTGFHCNWDSGQVGFIYVRLENIRNEYKVQRVSAKLREKVSECLKHEVKTYSDFIGGNVYGYVIEKDNEEIDSCWGFIGDFAEFCRQSALDSISI